MYNHFIFDIDGTLIDTERTGLGSLGRTVKEFLGVDMDNETLFRYFGIPSIKAAEMLWSSDPARFLERWEEIYQDMVHLSAPFEGIETVLKSLSGKGITLGLVTSRSRYEFEKDDHLAAWLDMFACAICSEDTLRHKPDPDPILAYMEKTGAVASECLYLGDTPHDAACAQGAGVDFALVDWNGRGIDIPSARYKLTSPGQIISISELRTGA